MSPQYRANTYAAVDLGSNSFHMIVARLEHGELRIIDRIKEMVRLAEGVDDDGRLSDHVETRVLSCLSRFGQRLRGIEDDNIRAVGTQALRRLRNSQAFLVVAETALGCPIEVINGREEARLIYTGVSQGVAGEPGRRLVIDIGGGSTELVIGEGVKPLLLESLQYGCVAVTQKYFPDGQLTEKGWREACNAVRADLQELLQLYRQTGWETAIGSSGTIRAVYEVCFRAGWSEKAVTAEALGKLRAQLLSAGHIDNISINGLTERRKPVFAGGVVILDACFEDLGIEAIRSSPYALREGVLYDLLGRLEHRDPRQKTVDALARRYAIDFSQAARVRDTTLAIYEQLAEPFNLHATHRDLLEWACQLHEIGLSIAHSSYQKHSGYLVANTDMAGFSRQEQQFLAGLVGGHRRALPGRLRDELPPRLYAPFDQLLMMLRIAVILCRTRDDRAIPDFMVTFEAPSLSFFFPAAWMNTHPLTMNDLQQEKQQLKSLDFDMQTSELAAADQLIADGV